MCRNHSHIVARLVGEDTSEAVPVLTFLLEQAAIKIEAPAPSSSAITMNTSGRLYVPSWLLGGLLDSTSPRTGVLPISLFLLPDGDMITTQQVIARSWSSFEISQMVPGIKEFFLDVGVEGVDPF